MEDKKMKNSKGKSAKEIKAEVMTALYKGYYTAQDIRVVQRESESDIQLEITYNKAWLSFMHVKEFHDIMSALMDKYCPDLLYIVGTVPVDGVWNVAFNVIIYK